MIQKDKYSNEGGSTLRNKIVEMIARSGDLNTECC